MRDISYQKVYIKNAEIDAEIQELRALCDLNEDSPPESLYLARDRGTRALVGMGARIGNTIRSLAVHPDYRGEGILLELLSRLRTEMASLGIYHSFIFTKVKNRATFVDSGYYVVCQTDKVILLENPRNFPRYLDNLVRRTEALYDQARSQVRGLRGAPSYAQFMAIPHKEKPVGAMVMNLNPMTLGHVALIHEAAQHCSLLHVFLVSEDRGILPANVRRAVAEEVFRKEPLILFHQTSSYMVSSATFPAYFLHSSLEASQAQMDLDLAIFAKIADRLGIEERWVGEEPFSPVTDAYNQKMSEVLAANPDHPVQLVVRPRYVDDAGIPVSASRVREYLQQGKWEEVRQLVPAPCFAALRASAEGSR